MCTSIPFRTLYFNCEQLYYHCLVFFNNKNVVESNTLQMARPNMPVVKLRRVRTSDKNMEYFHLLKSNIK